MFLGGLGTDASGAMLQSLVEKDGVRTVFARQPGLATGHCIALVRGHERTLCANLGAANKYETADLAPHKDTLLRHTKVASDKENVRVQLGQFSVNPPRLLLEVGGTST